MENLPAERSKTTPAIRMSPGGGLIPESFDGLWRMSCIFADSGLMPKGLVKKESVFVAIQMGLEVGLSPMQAVQNIAVINGRPSIWGDAALSLVRASGKMETFIEEIVGEWPNDDCKAICTVKRIGDAKETVRTFSCADAKIAGLFGKDGPWRQYPKRMLQMRARSWALRDAFTDVLKGVRVAEEQMDAKDMLTLQQDDLGSYSVSGSVDNTIDLSTRDTSLYGSTAKPATTATVDTQDNVPEITETPTTTETSEPADGPVDEKTLWSRFSDNMAACGIKTPESYNRACDFVRHNATVAGVDITDALQKAIAHRTDFIRTMAEWSVRKAQHETDWDPRKNELLGKYYPEKRDAVLKVAGEMGIATEGRTPKDVHADILAAANKPDEQPPDMAAEKSALIDKALGLSATNDQRWNAIVKTLSRAGVLQSSFIQEWSLDQLMQVIDEFEMIDNPDQEKF